MDLLHISGLCHLVSTLSTAQPPVLILITSLITNMNGFSASYSSSPSTESERTGLKNQTSPECTNVEETETDCEQHRSNSGPKRSLTELIPLLQAAGQLNNTYAVQHSHTNCTYSHNAVLNQSR